jgi:hypothetical protein
MDLYIMMITKNCNVQQELFIVKKCKINRKSAYTQESVKSN